TVVVDASSSNTSGTVSVGPGGTTTFSPASVTIKPGSTVTWTLSAGSHTVTCESFNSGTMSTDGQTFTHTFNTAGSFGYYCSFHGTPTTGMRGTVVVDASSSATTAAVSVGSGGNFFVPSSVTIKPGSTVTWTLAAGSVTLTV